jgi:tetratricopeptide (TPR) repeat protein
MKRSMQDRLEKPFIFEVESFLFKYYNDLIESKLDFEYANEALYYCMRVKDVDFSKRWFDKIVLVFQAEGNYSSLIPSYLAFIDMLEDGDTKVDYKISLADTYLKIEDLNSASNILKELSSITLSSRLVDKYYYIQASFSEISNNYEEAKIYYERALSQTLDDDIKINSLIALGNYYRKQRDYQKSLSLLNNTIDLIQI